VSPKAEKRNPVILDADQYAKLLTACDKRPMMLLYVTTLAEAGLQCDSEALHLRWEDVDLEDGFLRIASGRDGHRTKSGKARWVPMTPKLRQTMKDHFARLRFATYAGSGCRGCSTTPQRGGGPRPASASASCGGPSRTRWSAPSYPRTSTSTIYGTVG
jgi:integrase